MLEPFSVVACINLQFAKALQLKCLANQFFAQPKIMIQNSQNIPFQFSVMLLEVYEDKTPPPGASINHPVGHAVIRFRIQNLTQNNITANLVKIELRQPSNQEVIIYQTLNPLDIGGLQILEQGFHLTNPKGFANWKEFDAVVTYEWNGTIYTVDSAKFKVK